jgi:hypothetical protein
LNDDAFRQLLILNPHAVRLQAERDSYLKWQDRDALAWDLCRSAMQVNNGYAAGYISEPEAWQDQLAIAQVVQCTFTSWKEMSDNFLDGRQIWANLRDPHMEACAQLLLTPSETRSPWNQLPWETPLSLPEAGR